MTGLEPSNSGINPRPPQLPAESLCGTATGSDETNGLPESITTSNDETESDAKSESLGVAEAEKEKEKEEEEEEITPENQFVLLQGYTSNLQGALSHLIRTSPQLPCFLNVRGFE